MKLSILALMSFMIASNSGFAIPLLGETAGSIKYGNTTLYKDSNDPHKVYFFPNSTKFAVDSSGTPLFNFVYWGITKPTAEAGAYLTMATHLANDVDQKKALELYMKDHPDHEVAVLPIVSSSVGLKSTASGGEALKDLFKEFNFPPLGGRAEDEIGINAVLTPIGAKAFRALLQGDVYGSKLKVDYCFKTQGYGPNMDANIQAKMDRIYNYFEGSHSGGWGFFSWEIKYAIEKLIQNNDIKITVNGGDAKDWEMVNAVAAEITRRLFTPELSASPAVNANGGQGLFRFGGAGIKKEELKTENWTWTRRDLIEREFCPAVVIKDLSPYLNKLVVDADAH